MSRNVYVDKSAIDGKGLFAGRNFRRGEIVFILKGTLKRHKVRDRRTAMIGPNWFGVGKDLWIVPVYPFMLVNHSCNPNIGIKGKPTFVALRALKKGAELTFNYSITEEVLLWEMKNYESPVSGFRPIIRSIQYLPLKVYEKYLPYVPRYFQAVYRRYHNLPA